MAVLFQQNPYRYLYESDLQFHLAAMLDERLASKTMTIQGARPDPIQTPLVKTEYCGVYRRGRSPRFDIAILAEKFDGMPCPPKSDVFWRMPLVAAIELKYSQPSARAGLNSLRTDTNRLIEYYKWQSSFHNSPSFVGAALLFLQEASLVADLAFDEKGNGSDLQWTDSDDVVSFVISPDWMRTVRLAPYL